ncbi:hypothetical protein ACFQ9R_32845 [Nocardia sp. NPDC056541]|uniref:hypothetical protein n=1 Tax=Nocardia sp. NPDC056541 TaxID=3345860 RepID=UPI00366E663F
MTIATAERAAQDAAQAVIDLEERVRDGDTTVTATMLEKARKEASFAQLQIDAARRGVEKERQAEHAADVKAFMADYEEHMAGADLTDLRGAYADAVVSVAYLFTLLEDRRREQTAIMNRGQSLGLTVGKTPVPNDADRWREQFLNPATDFVALAVEEGQKGFASRNGQPAVHVLHTPERREEIGSLPRDDKHERGIEMRDRILNEAIAATEPA